MAKPTPFELQKLETVKEQGYAFFLIQGEGDIPPFVYSVGMAVHRLPDVLMFLDSTYCKPQLGMLTNFLNHMLEGLEMFPPQMLTEKLDGLQKTVSDPEITYDFTVLSPSDNAEAIRNYACRAHFFKLLLGDPQIVVVSSDFNPTWKEIQQLEAAA